MKPSAIAAIVPIFLLQLNAAPHLCRAETSYYLTVKTEYFKKNNNKIDEQLISFIELFNGTSKKRNINAESKGFTSEAYNIFEGKIHSSTLYYIEKGSEPEKEISAVKEGEKITINGQFKDIGKGIVIVHHIEKGWVLKQNDLSIQQHIEEKKERGLNYDQNWYEHGILKVPYKYDNKKYKIFLPYPSEKK